MLATYKGYRIYHHSIYDSSGNVFVVRKGYIRKIVAENVLEAVRLIDGHLTRLEVQAANN